MLRDARRHELAAQSRKCRQALPFTARGFAHCKAMHCIPVEHRAESCRFEKRFRNHVAAVAVHCSSRDPLPATMTSRMLQNTNETRLLLLLLGNRGGSSLGVLIGAVSGWLQPHSSVLPSRWHGCPDQ